MLKGKDHDNIKQDSKTKKRTENHYWNISKTEAMKCRRQEQVVKKLFGRAIS